MGQLFAKETRKEIIEPRSLLCVKCIVVYLKARYIPTLSADVPLYGRSIKIGDVHAEGLFRVGGRKLKTLRILSAITDGNFLKLAEEFLHAPIECGMALLMFVSGMKTPLIPLRVQELVLAENSGVSPQTVARDAMGLMKQELTARHMELASVIFELLYYVVIARNSNELDTSNLPVVLLPSFFKMKSVHLPRWRQISWTFNEMILISPSTLVPAALPQRGWYHYSSLDTST